MRLPLVTALCSSGMLGLFACGSGGGGTASTTADAPTTDASTTCDQYCDENAIGPFTVANKDIPVLSSAQSLCLSQLNCLCKYGAQSKPSCRNCKSTSASALVASRAAASTVCVESCTEDASAFLAPTAVTAQFLDFGLHACINTPLPSYEAFTHTSSVTFKNTHPSRGIAVSWVITNASNSPSFEQPPCQGSGCDGVLGRCFAFLGPGETSPSFVYDCDAVSNNSPVVNGSNVCVSGPVEVTMSVIAIAAFCTADSPNQAAFCEGPSRSLQETDAAPTPFLPVNVTGCPP